MTSPSGNSTESITRKNPWLLAGLACLLISLTIFIWGGGGGNQERQQNPSGSSTQKPHLTGSENSTNPNAPADMSGPGIDHDGLKPLPHLSPDGDKIPGLHSASMPAESAYGEIETIRQNERKDPTNGVIERVRLVRANFKYPLLRVEESLAVDDNNGTPREMLLKRTVMVADHVLVSNPDELLRAGGNYRILGEVAPGSGAWRVAIPAENTEDLPKALAQLQTMAKIAEPDYLVFHQQSVPNDPIFNDLWGMRNTGQTGGTAGADIKATDAWQHETGDGAITVAVIDSGVDYLHPDLLDNIYSNPAEIIDGIDNDGNGYIDDVRGWDFEGDDNDPMDDHYHGTHVAGTVGARGNNNVGVAGVIWNVKIMPLKFLSADGGGVSSDAIAAVRYTADNGVRISCNSWGGGGYSAILEDAIRYAGERNSLFVAAAGNSSNDNDSSPSYPASYELPNVISVAATDHNDQIAWFSNYGSKRVHIAAPGVGITSTFPTYATAIMSSNGIPTNYARISGTSMAAPHVVGAAALLLNSDPLLSTAQLRDRILRRADFLLDLSGLVSTSARLNVANLVDPAWVPPPAELVLKKLEWREVAGASNGDGVAGPGECIEFIADITNRGGSVASETVFSAQVVSGPASLVSATTENYGALDAYETIPQRKLAVIAVDASAQDLEEIVVRLQIGWQGGSSIFREITTTVARLPQIQVSREVDFSVGEMIRGPIPNTVFMLSPSAWRVIEVDTAAAEVSRYSDLDMSRLVIDGTSRTTGGLTTNLEGTRLYVALTGTRQIQVFSLPELAPLVTLDVDHQPYSLAMDARGRLFTTSMDHRGPLREVDVMDGRTLGSHVKYALNGEIYRGALLQTDAARSRLFLAETGLKTVGGPAHIYEWDVSGSVVGILGRHPMVNIYMNDFAIDEENNTLLSMHGGIYGVQVTSLTTGNYGVVWPLRSPYGHAVDLPPSKDHLFAGSGTPYLGVIRRFHKATGLDLGAYEVLPAASSARLKERGIVATENDRVLYASMIITGDTSNGIAGVHYFMNLTGSSSLNITMPPPTALPSKPLLAKVDFSDLAGNGDSIPNPGELIRLTPHIRNIGGASTPSGVLEIESLDARVSVVGTGLWDVPAIPKLTTVMLPDIGIQIDESVPDDTAVDFLFRLSLSDGIAQEFRHRIVIEVPQPPAGTSPSTMSSLQFTGLAANPSLNEVYLVDSRYLRVIALDTTYGMIRKIESIPVTNRLVNGKLVKIGEPAVSPDGSLLAVAGNETNQVFVFSLPEMKFLASHTMAFRPTHVTFDSLNRLHVTVTNQPEGTSLKVIRMEALSGENRTEYGANVDASPLRASKDGSLVGRRENDRLKIYNCMTEEPMLMHEIPLPPVWGSYALYDFEIDPAAGKAYLVVGDGKLHVHMLSDGTQEAAWSLNNPNWGSAVRICPNGELVAASDYWYGGGVRRYSPTGTTLQDVLLTDNNDANKENDASVMHRGLAVTPNGRVVFLARKWVGGNSTASADGYDYTVGIIGVPINLTEPGIDPLKLTGLILQDPSPANNNGYAEPGEKIVVIPNLTNTSFSLLSNIVISLESKNPNVVPVAPLSASFPAVNSGVRFSTTSGGLAANLSNTIEDGESLGLSLRISYSGGTQSIPLDLYATKTLRANVQLAFVPGMLLSDTSGNRVHLTDKTNNRILSIDTATGNVAASGSLAGVVGDGGIALTQDGSMVAAALTYSNRIQIFATENLASIDVIHLDFSPVSVAFGSNGRLYATSNQTWGRVREIDLDTGQVTTIGNKDYYRNSRLKHNVDHSRLQVFATELSGSSIALDEYDVESETPASVHRSHAYKCTGFNGDILLDEELNRIYVTVAGTDGIQVTNLELGITEGVWPFDSIHGRACAFLPGSPFVYGGSGVDNGRIRRFERRTGRPLADYPLAVPGVLKNFMLLNRGLAVARNGRVLFATSGTPSPDVYYLSLIGGTSLNMTMPLVQAKVNAGPDRTVKLSNPLSLQALLELSPGSGTPLTSWTKVKGPGSSVFSGNTAASTVNFSQPGRYQIQFSATVDGVISTDTVWVDVLPDDPSINISPISSKAMRHPGLRNGFILSRDGDSSVPLTVQLQHSGTALAGTDFTALPSSVVMAAGVKTVEIPLVLLPSGGVGTVNLTVSPAAGYQPGASSFATVSILSTTLTNWLAAAQEARPDLDLSTNGDANGNGLKNMMEYLLGRNPSLPDNSAPLALMVDDNPRSVTATFRTLKNPVGATLSVEFSNNLKDWSATWNEAPAVTILQRQDHGDGTETITVELSPSAAELPSAYLRLKADVQASPN